MFIRENLIFTRVYLILNFRNAYIQEDKVKNLSGNYKIIRLNPFALKKDYLSF